MSGPPTRRKSFVWLHVAFDSPVLSQKMPNCGGLSIFRPPALLFAPFFFVGLCMQCHCELRFLKKKLRCQGCALFSSRGIIHSCTLHTHTETPLNECIVVTIKIWRFISSIRTFLGPYQVLRPPHHILHSHHLLNNNNNKANMQQKCPAKISRASNVKHACGVEAALLRANNRNEKCP